MSAQDPIHQQIDFYNGVFVRHDYDSPTATHELEKAHFPYQWGVYTTAYARAALQDGINLAGEQCVYCDTDSVKTLGHVDFTGLNVSRETLAVEHYAFADDTKGNRHFMGVFEVDGQYDDFITQGAKRYAYTQGGKMHITVSGVTHIKHEESGKEYCIEELEKAGGLPAFRPGMIWDKAGGTCAVYNDDDDFDYTEPETGNTVHVGRNVAICDSTYAMTYSTDYERLLRHLCLYGQYRKDME